MCAGRSSGSMENPSPVKKGCGDQHGHCRSRRTSLFEGPLRCKRRHGVWVKDSARKWFVYVEGEILMKFG